MLKQFGTDRSGNVAMMFGLFLVPILIGAGVAIDILRANHIRSELADAADAGLLAAIRAKTFDQSLTNAEAETFAREYFNANYRQSSKIRVDDFTFSVDDATGQFILAVTGVVETAIMGIVGQEFLPIDILTEAKYAPGRPLEVALVLDNTFSMSGTKLSDLKDAASDLVETLMSNDNSNTQIGIVPFSQYVNVGHSRRNESWLEVEDDYTDTDPNHCYNTYPDRTDTNCTTVSRTCYRDGVPYDCSRQSCDTNLGDPVEICEPRTTTFTWRGCVGSRNNPLDETDADYNMEPVPGLLNQRCTNEITPLTNNKTKILDEIDNMAVQGNRTYVPAGLLWGMRLVSPGEPFDEGRGYAEIANENGVKTIILMTDGENTASASYPAHNDSSTIAANQKFEQICNEVKANDIQIYTIAFEVTNNSVKNLLADCADTSDHYFDAADSDQLADAFSSIAASLTELALTR